MNTPRKVVWALLMVVLGLAVVQAALAADEPLPSWQDGTAKRAIVDFVTRVTARGGPDFALESERIAAFDNDGTLWAEQPMYIQMAFVLDRVKALAPQHPEWKEKQPFKRRRRIYTPVDGEGLWHPARAGHRQHHQDAVRDARRHAGVSAPAGDRLH